ncbi:MAG: alpha-amylase family glycosyl hydrolase [Propionibacteriaceae bacterium]
MSSVLSGMGPIFYDAGVAFRVWAPNASEVQIYGDFNGWVPTAMAPEGSGNWYLDIPGALVGQKYKYKICRDGNWFDRIDPRAPQVTNSVGDGVLYDHRIFDWQGDSFTLPAFNELVIYELHVGSFLKTSSGPATLYDAVEQLDYLVDLGVNVIGLMPVMEFAGDYSWGYNPAHIFTVESAYGGPDALKTFVREAHKRGLAVLADVVYNHIGPSDLSTWQFDGWSENDKGGIYFYNDYRSATPWGDTRPDYGRSEVRDFIRDNARMWLQDYHVDGLRYDMTPYITSVSGSGMDLPDGWSLLRWINESLRADFPGKIFIAEDLHSDPLITDDGPDGACFHAQWDAQFVHPIREAAIVCADTDRSMSQVISSVLYRYNDDAFSRVIYTESHDEVANGKARVPQEIDHSDAESWYAQKRSTLAASLAFMSPGIPMIFQGQEFLQGSYFQDSVPLNWAHNDNFSGIVRLYHDLIKARRNLSGSTRGLQGQHTQILHHDDSKNLIAFHRWMDGGTGDSVVVIANFDANAQPSYQLPFPAAGRWQLHLNSDANIYSDNFSNFPAFDLVATATEPADGLATATISIGPYSVLVYSYAQ